MTKTRIQTPPSTQTINVLGYDIPVLEHVTVGEAIALEELAQNTKNKTSTEQNLEILCAILKWRNNITTKTSDFVDVMIDVDELEEAINVLARPFVRGFAKRLVRRRLLQAEQLEPKQLKETITETREYLTELERILLERTRGNEHKPS